MRLNWFSLNLILILFTFNAAQAFADAQKLRWLVAHGPEDPKVQTLIQKYAAQINTQTKGALKIEVTVPPAANWSTFKGWALRWHEAYEKVMSGEADIAQLATEEVANQDRIFDVFELPFLFRDHQQIEKMVEGPAGQSLLKRVPAATGGKLRALAFTFSGGFKVMGSSFPIQTAEDFKKLTLVRSAFPVKAGPEYIRISALKVLGANPTPITLDKFPSELFRQGKINALLSPYKELLLNYQADHLLVPYISDDNESVFTTIILVNEKTYQRLTKQQRKILTTDIRTMAREERHLFIEAAEQAKNELVRAGAKVSHLSPDEKAKLKQKAAPLYKEFSDLKGGKGLLDAIQKL